MARSLSPDTRDFDLPIPTLTEQQYREHEDRNLNELAQSQRRTALWVMTVSRDQLLARLRNPHESPAALLQAMALVKGWADNCQTNLTLAGAALDRLLDVATDVVEVSRHA